MIIILFIIFVLSLIYLYKLSNMKTNSETLITWIEQIEVFDWALWVWQEATDFDIWDIGSIPNLVKQDDIIFEYNQYKKPTWTSDCTLFWPFWALSDLKNKRLTDEDIESIRKLAAEKGKKDNKWRYTKLWVDTVVKWWNNNNKDKILYVIWDLLWADMLEALWLWYSLVVTFRGNAKYNQDIYADGRVDWIDFDPSTYWHCTRIRLINWKIMVIDSANWIVSYNKYELKDLKWLVREWTFYPTAYLILNEHQVEKSKQEIERLTNFRTLVEQNISNNSSMYHLSNDVNFQLWLHNCNNTLRNKLEDIKTEEK